VPHASLARLRKLCLSLPETTEVKAWDAPTFRVRGRIFAMYSAADNTHGGRESVWLASDMTNQMLMIADNPERFFKPAYVGPYGWVGVYLDKRVSWKLVKELVGDAHEYIVTKMKNKRTAKTGRRPKKLKA
jgi:predicted DNA-binding protein (MmcQ/YjbR family)